MVIIIYNSNKKICQKTHFFLPKKNLSKDPFFPTKKNLSKDPFFPTKKNLIFKHIYNNYFIMSNLGLGEIENTYDVIISFLNSKNLKKNLILTYKEKISLYEELKNHIRNLDIDVDSEIVCELFMNFFDIQYKFEKKSLDKIIVRDFENLKENKEYVYKINEIYNDSIKIPKKYQKIWNQFMKLYKTPQPEQRTPEWYVYRSERITASDAATAIGEHAKEKDPNKLIIKKCDPDFFPFEDNIFCHHGKKYERIATMIYEHIENVKITEFGCLPHPTIPFLGASPDGICSRSTLDHKFSPLVGRMLEIKCPYTRQIQIEGKVDDGICPHYYYLQVLLQMECCDLDECDFIQCRLTEYQNRFDFINDEQENTEHYRCEYNTKTTVKAKKINLDNRWLKGCIIQFLPKDKIGDPNAFYSAKYIYPPTLNFTPDEYDIWVNKTLSELNKNTEGQKLLKEYYFDKVLYWKLEKTCVLLIERDVKWFETNLPKFKNFWDKVLYYRQNPDKLEELKQKYKKKSNITINSDSKKMIDTKNLFLNDDDDLDFTN